MLLYVLCLILTWGVLFYVYQCYRRRKLPPLMEGSWLIGGHALPIVISKNLHDLLTSKMNELLEKRIEVVTVKIGIWDIFAILNPDDASLVATSLTKDHSIYRFLKPFFGDGLVTADVSTWKIHRKLINPTFNQHVLDGYLYEFNDHTRQLVDTLAKEVDKGPFDHFNYLKESILKTVCATSMGTSIDDEDTREIMFTNKLQEFVVYVTERIFKFWLHIDFVYFVTGRKKKQDALADQMNTLSQAIFKKKKGEFSLNKQDKRDTNTTEKRYKSFIELLLELSEDNELNNQEISDELNTFIAAGSDTVIVSLSNVLTCVGSYKAVQDKIIEELQEVFQGSDRDVEKQDLPKLKYLEAVIKETLRLYPVAPFIGRILEKDTEIQGYTLPAGSKCYILLYGLLRHWTWGPDVDTFRPERWLDGSLPTNLKAFAAFGVGKRSCIGANFAIIIMKTFLASILRRYIVAGDVTKMEQEFTVTNKPISGYEISIKNRQKGQNI